MAPVSPDFDPSEASHALLLGTGSERTGLEADIVRQMVQVFLRRRKVFGQATSVSTQTDKAELGACYTFSLVSPGIVRDESGRGRKKERHSPLLQPLLHA